MSHKNVVLAIPLTNIDSTTVAATYKPINPLGLDEACYCIRLTNNSTQNVTVSFDGTHDHEFIFTGETLFLYAQPNQNLSAFNKGLKLYVKGTAGEGNIYLSGYYQIPAN